MSSDLYGREVGERLATLEPTQTVEAGAFDGFLRGTGKTAMRALARTGSAVDLLGAMGPMVQDAFTDGTEAQDRYFKEHDEVFGSAVDYWTPKPGEVGVAGQLTGELLTMLPMVLASPGLTVTSLYMGEAEQLQRQGVPTEKAQLVGAIQAAGLGLGIWMPILGRTLTQRMLLGGAGFNVVQGVGTRAASEAVLEGTPQAEMYKALDPTYLTLDVLLGLGFGGIAHLSPAMRAQGGEALERLAGWAQGLQPSQVDAMAAMRQAQHMAADSLPGRPIEPKDAEFHVERTRQAIEQLARNQPVDVSDLPEPRLEPLVEAQAERAQNLEELVAAAEEVRASEGLPAAPEPQAPPRRLVPEDMTMVPPERQARALGQAVENRLLELKVGELEAKANAALWESFFETTSRKYGVPVADIVSTYGIDVRRMSRSEMALDALGQPEGPLVARAAEEGYVPPRGQDQAQGPRRAPEAAQEPEDLPATVAGGRPAQGWARATRASREGRPIPLYRGAAELLAPEHFGPDSLGQASSNPSAGLGVWFTPSKAEAATYGKAQEAYLDIRNPKVIRVEDLPAFETVAEATKFREQLRAAGHDSIIVTAKHLGGKTHLVAFDPAQVIPSTPAQQVPGETLFQSEARSQIVQTAKAVQERWYSDLARQLEVANIKAAPAKGWKDYLKGLLGKGAVKAEELKWTGLEEWLDMQGGRVTKDAVLQFVKENGVKVEETVLGSPEDRTLGDKAIAEPIKDLEKAGFTVEVDPNAEMANMPGEVARIAFLDSETGDIVDASEIRAYATDQDTQLSAEERGRLREAARAAEYIEKYWYGAPASERPTKFGTYQMPGGENYREVLLTLPGPDPDKLPKGYKIREVDQQQHQALEKNLVDMTATWKAWLEEHDYPPLSADDFSTYARRAGYGGVPREHVQYAKQFERAWNDTQSLLINESRYTLEGPDGSGNVLRGARTPEEAMDQAMSLLDNQGVLDKGVFRESHWEQSNVLAHVRFNERTDADGKKVLFIEEIQSDWAQKGKKKGFQGEPAKYTIREDNGVFVVVDQDGAGVNYGNTRAEAERWAAAHAAESLSGVPRAPFVAKTEAWVGLVLKRMIREAAERGFDRIAWTTGEQQTNRYTSALRKAVDTIEWKKTDKGVQIVGYKGQGRSYEQPSAREEELLRRAAHGETTETEMRELAILNRERHTKMQKVVDTTEKEDVLSDAIGKTMADRIRNDPNQEGTIEGEGIVVADTGMASFYDRIVPTVAKEVLKKLGVGKVGKTKIETGKGGTNEPPELDTRGTEPPNMLSIERGGSVAETFQGAEPFRNGDQPLYGEATVNINGIEHDVAVLAARDGVHIISDGEPEFELMLENLQIGAGSSWGADFAKRFVNDLWRGSNSLIDRFTVIRGEVQGKSAPTEQLAIDITPELRERALSGMPLFQGGERGAIKIGPETVIGLFENADPSTFLHESAHLFLQINRDLVSRGRAMSLEALDDWAALSRWLGIKDGQITRAQQEKFATTFERYLAEGEAPSPELRSVFQQFRDWLLGIYRSIANIAEDIPAEIKGVLDRMLASQKRDPAPKAEGPPQSAAEPPPPPGEAGAAGRPEAQAFLPEDELAAGRPQWEPRGLDDLQVRESLTMMAEAELGWEQIGARRADASISTTSGQPNFTKWIPKSELWPGRPDKAMNEVRTREAVRKALAGEKLKAGEQRMVDYMLEIANARMAAVERIGGPEEWNATAQDLAGEGLEPSTQNVLDADLVSRAAAKDEIALETAAQKYENDDAAFMAEVRKILGKDLQQDQAARGGGKEGEGAPGGERAPGEAEDPVAAAAEEYVASNPEQLLAVGENADGTPIQKTVRQYLDDEIMAAGEAREDAGLVRAAAKCLLGRA